jgi:hypothetical protein
MHEPDLRAGDSDRAAVATALGRHMAEGRLTVAEYEERVTRAYAARTFGDLAGLTEDLPATEGPRAVQSPGSTAPGAPCGPHRPLDGNWRSWQRTASIVLVIWLITSLMATSFSYFWPMWVIVPWGVVLLMRTLSGGRRRYPTRGSRTHS